MMAFAPIKIAWNHVGLPVERHHMDVGSVKGDRCEYLERNHLLFVMDPKLDRQMAVMFNLAVPPHTNTKGRPIGSGIQEAEHFTHATVPVACIEQGIEVKVVCLCVLYSDTPCRPRIVSKNKPAWLCFNSRAGTSEIPLLLAPRVRLPFRGD